MLRMQDLVNENTWDADAGEGTRADSSPSEGQQSLSSPREDLAMVASPWLSSHHQNGRFDELEDSTHSNKQRALRGPPCDRKRKSITEPTPFAHDPDTDGSCNGNSNIGTPLKKLPPPASGALSDQIVKRDTGTLDPADARRRQQLKEASKRCRKRQKDESMVFSIEINTLHQKLALLHSKLESSGIPSVEENRSAGHHRFQMKRLVEFLEKKLSDHKRWLRSVRSLMVAAPLFDFAANLAQESPGGSSTVASDLKYLDDWREDCEHERFSRVLMNQRVEDVVRSSSKNASDLLKEFAARVAHFQRHHTSRGWAISTTSGNALLGFHCERQLRIDTPVKDTAFKLWHSVQRDDILRTFIPMLQESTLAHESRSCSITRRLLQRSPSAPQQAVVTVESIANVESCSRTNAEAWQISIEVIDDHYLCLLAAEKADEAPPLSPLPPASIASTLPTAKQASTANSQLPDDGLSSSGNAKAAGRFTIAVRVLQSVGGIIVKLVGCAQHEECLQRDDSASFDLLQYFVTMLPVYEELHLVQSGTM